MHFKRLRSEYSGVDSGAAERTGMRGKMVREGEVAASGGRCGVGGAMLHEAVFRRVEEGAISEMFTR